MLIDRGWSFLTNRQTIYWIGVISGLILILALRRDIPLIFFGATIPISENTIPGIIIAVSILATALWSYAFLLLPIHNTEETFRDKPTCKVVFFLLCYGTLIAAFLLVFVYGIALKDGAHEFGYSAIRKTFAEAGGPGILLHEYHLIAFVAVYTAMDSLVAVACTNERQKRQFADVVIFVDLPILLSMAFVQFVLKPKIGLSFHIFEAGVVSFQLIAGSLSVIGFEVLEDRVDQARGTTRNGSDDGHTS